MKSSYKLLTNDESGFTTGWWTMVGAAARQLDHAKGHAFDRGFPVHEGGDPVGR